MSLKSFGVIVGAAHSGTTILFRMLAYHPALGWTSQFSQRHGGIPNRFALPGYSYVNRFGRSILTHPWEKAAGLKQWVVPCPSEAPTIWAYVFPSLPITSIVATLDSESINTITSIDRLRNVVEREAEDWRRDRILVKYPDLSTKLETIEKTFSDYTAINVVRDGRAVAVSVYEKKRRHYSPRRARKEAIEYWRARVKGIRAYSEGSGGNANIINVRYEDLCKNTHREISRCLEMLGCEISAFPFSRIPQTLTSTNPDRLRVAEEAEWSSVFSRKEVRRELEAWGY